MFEDLEKTKNNIEKDVVDNYVGALAALKAYGFTIKPPVLNKSDYLEMTLNKFGHNFVVTVEPMPMSGADSKELSQEEKQMLNSMDYTLFVQLPSKAYLGMNFTLDTRAESDKAEPSLEFATILEEPSRDKLRAMPYSPLSYLEQETIETLLDLEYEVLNEVREHQVLLGEMAEEELLQQFL